MGKSTHTYAIPEVALADNGSQFIAKAYMDFSTDYNFDHRTSSQHYPESNGEAGHNDVESNSSPVW